MKRSQTPCRARPLLECLEERLLLDGTVIEDFESGDLSAYTTILRINPSAQVTPAAAHDGNYGLDQWDGDDWIARADDAVQMQQGNTVSVWLQFAGNADGRAYFGFGATPPEVNGHLNTGRTLSLVLAPNTGELQIQQNRGFEFQSPDGTAGTTVLGSVPQIYDPDHWYRLEVNWGVGGFITGNLYDSDGTTLLNTVTGQQTSQFGATSGGIAFRAFGSDKYWDTVTLDTGTAGPAAPRHVSAYHTPAALPLLSAASSSRTPGQGPPTWNRDDNPLPFDYTSVPGTGIDVQMDGLDQLQQVPGTGIIDGMVGLTYRNVSFNMGLYQYGWGPAASGLDRVGTPVNSPDIQFYMYRELPAEETLRIGESGLKRVYDSDQPDFQFLPAGVRDTYQFSNYRQRYWSPATDINPVTGERYNLDYLGQRDENGVYVYVPRQYSSPIENLLTAPADALDPAQNPAGTRWFLAGNIFVVGDQDVSNNSRWVEVAPHRNGDTFTFTYPQGSTGQLDIRTMPGLNPPSGPGRLTAVLPTALSTAALVTASASLLPAAPGQTGALPETYGASQAAVLSPVGALLDQVYAQRAGSQPLVADGSAYELGRYSATGDSRISDNLVPVLPG